MTICDFLIKVVAKMLEMNLDHGLGKEASLHPLHPRVRPRARSSSRQGLPKWMVSPLLDTDLDTNYVANGDEELQAV